MQMMGSHHRAQHNGGPCESVNEIFVDDENFFRGSSFFCFLEMKTHFLNWNKQMKLTW